MGLPRKLKNLNAFIDGESFLGIVSEFTQPKLALKTEEYRGGGMLGPVMIDMGLEAMDAEMTMGGLTLSLIRKFGATQVDAVRVRLVGAYQADNGSAVRTAEVYIGGRFTEIDMGDSKVGDDTEHKFKVPLSYYKLVVDGRTEIEIDMLSGVFLVDGIDRYADIMAAIT